MDVSFGRMGVSERIQLMKKVEFLSPVVKTDSSHAEGSPKERLRGVQGLRSSSNPEIAVGSDSDSLQAHISQSLGAIGVKFTICVRV